MNDLQFKAKLKKILLITNITLSVILFALLVSWLLVLRPAQVSIATAQEQYASYDLANLPNFKNTIESDYFGAGVASANDSGIVNNAAGDHMEASYDYNLQNSGTGFAEEAERGLSGSDLEPDEILDKASEILDRSKKLAASAGNAREAKHIDESGAHSSEGVSSKIVQSDILPGAEGIKGANAGGVSRLKKMSAGGKIAIIVTNLGLNKKPTEMALGLPKQCALGFLPYTKTLKPLLHQAQSEGHEIYLYLPMQTSRSYENPGKYALLGNLPTEENIMRLNVILNSHARYDGVYSSFKEVFTSNPKVSEFLFNHLEGKNLIFLMGKSFGANIPAHLQDREKLLYSSIILDKQPDQEEIKENLEKLVKMALENGSALGYSQGYSLSIDMINEWIPSLRERGIKLVPASELLK